jgi:hypothetical protein
LFVMVALPALEVSVPPNCPNWVRPPALFVMLALFAVLALKNWALPPKLFAMTALPAVAGCVEVREAAVIRDIGIAGGGGVDTSAYTELGTAAVGVRKGRAASGAGVKK